MVKQNIELVNKILNEVGQYIIGTVSQYSLEWDYACFVSYSTAKNPQGEFHLFHKQRSVSFKSNQLILILHKLFEDYKKSLNTNTNDVYIKYTIRNLDLKVDVKVGPRDSLKWITENNPEMQNLFQILVADTFTK